MRRMGQIRRLLSVVAAASALAAPLAGHQDAAGLQGADPPRERRVGRQPRPEQRADPASARAARADDAAGAARVQARRCDLRARPAAARRTAISRSISAAPRTKFVAMVGIDDGVPPAQAPAGAARRRRRRRPGSVVFGAWVDGKKVFESDVMKRGDAPKPVSIDLTGAKTLVLAVVDAQRRDRRRQRRLGRRGDRREARAAGADSRRRRRPSKRRRRSPPSRTAGADDQLSANHRRHAGTSVPVPDSGVRRRAR